MSTDPRSQVSRNASKVRATAGDLDGFDALDSFGVVTQSTNARRIGVILFWAAVACLLGARIVLFDPAATRSVGSFGEHLLPTAAPR